jgi:glycosyltransferase involved in cell wall biosynthesis
LIGPRETNVGGGGAIYISELNQLAEGLPVEFRPSISDPEKLAKELCAASIYCYPSLAEKGESFGVAPLEAMATGLAVVVSSLSVFRDFIKDGETGLVFDHRSNRPEQELAAKLRILLTDDQLRNKIERQAAITARQFGYEKVADAFLNDFDNLAQTADTQR